MITLPNSFAEFAVNGFDKNDRNTVSIEKSADAALIIGRALGDPSFQVCMKKVGEIEDYSEALVQITNSPNAVK